MLFRSQKQKPLLLKAMHLKYRKYPYLLKALEHRHLNYNKTMEYIERDKNCFVIRPSKNIEIDRLERDKNKLQEAYDLGYTDGNQMLQELLEFIKK